VPSARIKMFLQKKPLVANVHVMLERRFLAARCAAEVDTGRLRNRADVSALPENSRAKVHVLPISEEAIVKPSYFAQTRQTSAQVLLLARTVRHQ
jgi:hypothetical protein